MPYGTLLCAEGDVEDKHLENFKENRFSTLNGSTRRLFAQAERRLAQASKLLYEGDSTRNRSARADTR